MNADLDHRLRATLRTVAARAQRAELGLKLAAWWGLVALLAVALLWVEHASGWGSAALPAALILLALLGAVRISRRHRRAEPDWRALARSIELRNPELNGRLLTAIQQHPEGSELNFLQQRLVQEVLLQARHSDWTRSIPFTRLLLGQGAQLLALLVLGLALWNLRTTGGHRLFARIENSDISVTPGDTTIERGNSLVVLARFAGRLPANVELVLSQTNQLQRRIPLVKTLADPVFGGSIAELAADVTYHVEYAGERTRDFQVKVFEYPRLDRADADLKFPDYTRQPPKRIEDTRRVSAVEGSHLDLVLQLNKPVASAHLVSKDKQTILLAVETNRATAALKQFTLKSSQSYELQLTDTEGRTNKAPVQFVFAVLTNRTPELHLTSPHGDVRPSPLEEISFEGTVWDDFGVIAYGLGYTLQGKEPKFVELGRDVPAKEKRSFNYTLRLEELGVQPDDLVAWFVWGDDIGPDSATRRSTSDLFFGEVRPFEEVFREGQGMEGESQQGQQGGQQRDPASKLTELQKQIINATWKLQRTHPGPLPQGEGDVQKRSGPQSSGSSSGHESSQLRDASPEESGRGLAALQNLAVVRIPNVFGQVAGGNENETEPAPPPRGRPRAGSTNATYLDDAVVVRDSQAEALGQTEAAARRQPDPRSATLWQTARREMQKALTQLDQATNSPALLPDALAAEQAAYQALLKVQQHEYQVTRNRNRNQSGGGGRSEQMQRQLEEMDLTQSENRYETQRQAQRPQQRGQQQEQLQIMSRLQELARRQQDVNERLKELQTALQEARTEQEREEIRRRLKRLQEEEQQMLADVDEVRQRMDRPENQSQMSDERRQLDETRNDVQRASEAASQGAVSQALASGSRAQQQLQQLREQMRKENSNQFSDDVRQMRAEARDLATRQQEIQQKLENETTAEHKSLADSPGRKEALEQLARQQQRMTNLVDRATQVSQQAEEAEPLLSRQLYDSVRKFSQDSAKNLKQSQEELLSRGLMTPSLYEKLKESSAPDGAKMLELSSEMVRSDFIRQATETTRRSGASIEELKRGVENAAESVLGDDTEALRQAQDELDKLTSQLQNEAAQAQGGANGTNAAARAQAGSGTTNGVARAQAGVWSTNVAAQAQAGGASTNGSTRASTRSAQSGSTNSSYASSGGQNASDEQNPSQSEQSQPSQNGATQGTAQRQNGQSGKAGRGDQRQAARGQRAQADETGGGADNLSRLLDTLSGSEGGGGGWGGPITGGDYTQWSDRLRDVEEMIEIPDLRNAVAIARERARLMRQEFKRDLKKPDWATVRLQVVKPLVEVRDKIADELARRQSNDALVPIDRDPVPSRYSELVKRYYEELGRDNPSASPLVHPNP